MCQDENEVALSHCRSACIDDKADEKKSSVFSLTTNVIDITISGRKRIWYSLHRRILLFPTIFPIFATTAIVIFQ